MEARHLTLCIHSYASLFLHFILSRLVLCADEVMLFFFNCLLILFRINYSTGRRLLFLRKVFEFLFLVHIDTIGRLLIYHTRFFLVDTFHHFFFVTLGLGHLFIFWLNQRFWTALAPRFKDRLHQWLCERVALWVWKVMRAQFLLLNIGSLFFHMSCSPVFYWEE